MKKIVFVFSLAVFMYACSGNKEAKTETTTTQDAGAKKDITEDPAYIAGVELVGKSDCPTCHKPEETSTGPSFVSIANKYPNTPATLDTLVHKVIKGGSGNWGTVPMAAHPAVSEADAATMIKYILMHKK
ncbi:MAG: c-type cytochrome [Ferruginibacter sp.]